MFSHRSAAAGYDDVGMVRHIEGIDESIERVCDRAAALGIDGELARHGKQHRAVAGRDLMRRAGFGIAGEFVAAVDHGHARLAADRQVLVPRRDRQRRVGGADERSGRDNFAALPEIEAAGADVLVRWHRRFAGQRDFVVLAGQIFLQDYRCRACGEQGSGGHLNGLPFADFTRIGMPGSAFSDDLPGAGEIVRGNRIAVHRRKVGGGLRAPRQQRLGQIATDGAFDVDMFGRQRPGKVE